MAAARRDHAGSCFYVQLSRVIFGGCGERPLLVELRPFRSVGRVSAVGRPESPDAPGSGRSREASGSTRWYRSALAGLAAGAITSSPRVTHGTWGPVSPLLPAARQSLLRWHQGEVDPTPTKGTTPLLCWPLSDCRSAASFEGDSAWPRQRAGPRTTCHEPWNG